MNKTLVNRGVAILFVVTAVSAASVRADHKDVDPQAVRKIAQQMGDALLAGDFEKLADFMHPRVVEMSGGRKHVIELSRLTAKQMADAGVNFTAFTAEAPTQFSDSGTDIVTIVPQTIELRGGGKKITIKSYLVGVSSNGGKAWTFIDATTVDEATLKILLPKFPADLKLPEKQKPVVEDLK